MAPHLLPGLLGLSTRDQAEQCSRVSALSTAHVQDELPLDESQGSVLRLLAALAQCARQALEALGSGSGGGAAAAPAADAVQHWALAGRLQAAVARMEAAGTERMLRECLQVAPADFPEPAAAGATASSAGLYARSLLLHRTFEYFTFAGADERDEILPPAAQLAAELHEFAQLPEQQATARLALARAAAERSCAFLGCPNLASGHAREEMGKRNQLCSACRMVRCVWVRSGRDWGRGERKLEGGG